MPNDPIDLDERRDMADQKSTDIRRRLQEIQDDHLLNQLRQDALESIFLSAPAKTWPDVAAKAQYLIHLFSATPEAQAPRRKELIAQTISDLERLFKRT